MWITMRFVNLVLASFWSRDKAWHIKYVNVITTFGIVSQLERMSYNPCKNTRMGCLINIGMGQEKRVRFHCGGNKSTKQISLIAVLRSKINSKKASPFSQSKKLSPQFLLNTQSISNFQLSNCLQWKFKTFCHQFNSIKAMWK